MKREAREQLKQATREFLREQKVTHWTGMYPKWLKPPGHNIKIVLGSDEAPHVETAGVWGSFLIVVGEHWTQVPSIEDQHEFSGYEFLTKSVIL